MFVEVKLVKLSCYFAGLMCCFIAVAGEGCKKCSAGNGHRNLKLVNQDICGLSFTDRIIGGTDASLGQFPWLARIGYVNLNKPQKKTMFKCGGALINENYVLTASHCVIYLPNATAVEVIRLGEYDTDTEIDCDNGMCAEPLQDLRPSKIMYHARYGEVPYKNDIALIRLEKPAILNGWVVPICLPSGPLLQKDLIGSRAEVAGWGVVDVATRAHNPVLQYVQVPIVDRERCEDAFASFTSIGPTQLCAGGETGEDSCAGDSGGPLMKVEASAGPPRYYIIGMVSFGARICGAPVPAVYTRIHSYMRWILDHIEP